jgi:adenosylmethionine---8-amino-7-oxononanoate aminotransferase
MQNPNLLAIDLLSDLDKQLLWHPYSSMTDPAPVWQVVAAEGVYIELEDGHKLIDGMSSWWCMIHGYNHPVLNAAAKSQIDKFSHVMFGGLTHQPAIELAQKLVEITPAGLDKVFFSDSGSVSVEVALKMALQYWQALGQTNKTRFVSLRHGYHGDTWGAMSVCDPDRGMHHLFKGMLADQFFVDSPSCKFGDKWNDSHIQDLEQLFSTSSDEIAALILEPVVQNAGGMHFYSPEYLRRAREICDQYDVLLIADEIATGFGRTGKLFGCDWAEVSPDIICVGKALTGGYISLAATLCTDKVSAGICGAEPGVFMHGPTYMANPLACAIANASLDLLLHQNWQARIAEIETELNLGLVAARELRGVKEVRVLGAIGVIELHEAVNQAELQSKFVEQGVWVRPFGSVVYLMPPYIIETEQLHLLCEACLKVVAEL